MASTRYLTTRRIQTRYEGGPEHRVIQPITRGLQVRRKRKTRSVRDLSRRAVNLVASFGLIIVTAPIMLVIAILVKATSRGPVLYTQPRVGLDRRAGPRDRRRGSPSNRYMQRRMVDHGGRVFRIFKFRTMTVDQPAAVETWASPDDPRITPVGRVLRRYRLDELPQLFNVFLGDMNLVGPRPEQPRIFAELRDKIDHYPVRQRVLPGITGWAQVNSSYDQSLDDVRKKINLDLEYLDRRSAMEDIRIMVRTVPVVLLKRGSM